VPGKSFRPQAAVPRQSPEHRPPAAAPRAGQGRSQSSHRPLKPLQLELFGNRRPETPSAPPERRFPQLAAPSGVGRQRPDPSRAAQTAISWGAAAQPESVRTQLFRRLSRLTGGRLRSLSLTDNRRTILSVRPVARERRLGLPAAARAPIDLRIHPSFAGAGEAVLRAVAAFLESAKGSGTARHALAAIRDHFHHHRVQRLHTIQPLHPSQTAPPGTCSPRQLAIDPLGCVIDLREVAGDLNQRYFGGRLKVRITWGKATGETAHNCRRSRSASLQLGSYSYEDRLIRIHRVLNRDDVPRFVIESVVYHELLHADLPPVTRNGRRYFHTPEFRRREAQFRHHEKADLWVRQNLQLLLRARREAAASSRRR
jgi:hypothetical protein